MDTETISNLDVLTVTVLLPESDQDRNALFEYIANNGDIQGGIALNAVHGNLINRFRAQAGLNSDETVDRIIERLDASTRWQVSNAMSKMKAEPSKQTDPCKTSNKGTYKLPLMMFILGALFSYNFF
ncbi:hypothetical protein [Comamonas thiooxydans]|uniref:hypothetical protein n=1 Tax=Comamonas thiooxydans TaxID=363952 RepID=UPI00103D4DBD|nr:hypothetical protein [Comamonas thiooxydans]